jgi:replication factor A2
MDLIVLEVTFVAQIRSVANQTTNNTFKLDDGTGTIEAKQWVDSDSAANGDDQGGSSKLGEQVYVRVFGKLKSFNGKRHLGASVIRPIDDLNEIQCHLLEATVVHLFYSRGPPAGPDSKTNGANGNQAPAPYKGGGVEGRVYECIRTSVQSNEGLHVSDIAQRLNLDQQQVMAACESLSIEGKIYTTVDEYTWALLASM